MADTVLEGVRIIDWTIALAGPKGTAWLAALGAEVIHVEQPGAGDQRRNPSPLQGVPTLVGDGLSSLFEGVNFNKKSMTLDLSQEEGMYSHILPLVMRTSSGNTFYEAIRGLDKFNILIYAIKLKVD